MSGLSTRRFAFEAFLPSDKKERREILKELVNETRTMIIYEAPHRLVRTLNELLEVLGDRKITVCRELTKRHETAFATTIRAAIDHYTEQDPKGECVLVIEGKSREELKAEERSQWESMSVEEHVAYYEGQGSSRKEAMKLAAKDRGIGKRDVYQMLLENK
jgi:16S rRNA (cytidine1402-2'-O)-methyltransferase